jgi:hypothetical protein
VSPIYHRLALAQRLAQRLGSKGYWVVHKQWKAGTAQTRKLDWPIGMNSLKGQGRYRMFYTKELARQYAKWCRARKPPRGETQARRKARARS